MKGENVSPGSCPNGAQSSPVDVRLVLVDDDGDTVLDATNGSVVCTSGETHYEKFIAQFEGPLNCKDSEAPVNISRGDIDAAVTDNRDCCEGLSGVAIDGPPKFALKMGTPLIAIVAD